MNDAYIKEFTATVQTLKDNNHVVLSETAFYPRGGGQPCDIGVLVCDGDSYNVVFVEKCDGVISHEVDRPGLKTGAIVQGRINWERRYRLMRAHTASHVISAVFHNDFGAQITGNQLSEEKIRIDFNLEDFDRELLQSSIDKVNGLLQQDLPVSISYLARAEALQDSSLVKLAGALPPAVKELRIVSIGEVDKQADGGTHVRSTKEVGTLELVKAENKGKNNRRVYVRLVD